MVIKKDLEKILDDSDSDDEFKTMAETELKDLKLENETIEKKLKLFLLPKDDADKKNAIWGHWVPELFGEYNQGRLPT